MSGSGTLPLWPQFPQASTRGPLHAALGQRVSNWFRLTGMSVGLQDGERWPGVEGFK